ncbi:TIGR03943 family putative permease subunit [Microbacterium sp. JZ31]|uniref:TIGR03943 family putative permease subunit n=1 Tax=Microbacterium sp. JZ31 TaxID=1906274 RepID=UPI001EE4DA7E|nr:TIGR03943 family protein [Microbacterium sp. JZ31]
MGLAAVLAVVTLGLAATGRLALYINPDQAWFAVGMAVLALVGAVASFALPLGAEADHGHDHGDHEPHERPDGSDSVASLPRWTGSGVGSVAVWVGGVAASAVAVTALVLPPASLSVELAMARDTGTAPLFAGADEVLLAAADTSTFGVGDWASVFSSATSPDSFEGTQVTLTGFVAPADDGSLRVGRLVVTHCVIDAQPATVPVAAEQDALEAGAWVEVDGVVTTDAAGALVIQPREITAIDAPDDPYEY